MSTHSHSINIKYRVSIIYCSYTHRLNGWFHCYGNKTDWSSAGNVRHGNGPNGNDCEHSISNFIHNLNLVVVNVLSGGLYPATFSNHQNIIRFQLD